MAQPVFPGTNRRFRPSFLLGLAGGDDAAKAEKLWNARAKGHYHKWIDDISGTGVGVFMPRLTFRTLCPSRGRYDWSRIESVMDKNFFKTEPLMSMHWRIGSEGAMPGWFPGNWSGSRQGRLSINIMNSATRSWIINEFLVAVSKKFDNDERVFSFCWDETSAPDGVNSGQWGNSLVSLVNEIPKKIKKLIIFKFHHPASFSSGHYKKDVHPANTDPKICQGGCSGNFPNNSVSGMMGVANLYSVAIKNPPKGHNRVFLTNCEPNGWLIAGNRSLANPWGNSFPSSCPKLSCAKGIHPMSYVWAHSYKPRATGSKANSNLGRAGADPAGLAPASYIVFQGASTKGGANRANSHECETHKQWQDAMRVFGGDGTRAAPVIPWNWTGAPGPGPDPDPDPGPDPECPDVVNAALSYEVDMEGGLNDWGAWTTLDQPTGGSWAHTVETSIARRGNQCMKSEVRYEGAGLKYRAEYLEVPRVAYPGEERWYGVSVYFPSGFDTGPGRCVFLQNHGKSPNSQQWELAVNGNQFQSILYSGNQEAFKFIDKFSSVQTGIWYDFVVHAKYRTGSGGKYEVWLDGTRVINRSPSTGTGSTNVAQMIIQIGAYCPGWTNTNPGGASPLKIYHDEFRIADGVNGYKLVAPNCQDALPPGPDPEPLPTAFVGRYVPATFELTDDSYPTDKYNINDPVVFTHSDGTEIRSRFYYAGGISFKFKFTPTKVGTWTYETFSTSAALNGVKGIVECKLNNRQGFLTKNGNKWKWKNGREFVPQISPMSHEVDYYVNNPSRIAQDVNRIMQSEKFTGVHIFSVGGYWFNKNSRTTSNNDTTFDQEIFEVIEEICERTYALGGMTHIWWWGSKNQNTTALTLNGGINGTIDQKLQKYIAARLGPMPGVTYGYGWDCDKWVNAAQLDAWRINMLAHTDNAWYEFCGARPAGPNTGINHAQFNSWNDGLNYYSYEHHSPTYSVYKAALANNSEFPVFSEDRFRVRGLHEKDYTEAQIRRGLYHSTIAGGVANIWTYQDPSSATGTATAFPNASWISNYSTFWFGDAYRFLAGLQPYDAAIIGNQMVCADTDKEHLIIYCQNTSEMKINLSGMNGSHTAVLLDTQTSNYTEVDGGVLAPGVHTYSSLAKRDWIVAVGDFGEVVVVTATSTATASVIVGDVVATLLPGKESLVAEGYEVYLQAGRTITVGPATLSTVGNIPWAIDADGVDETPPTEPNLLEASAVDHQRVFLQWTTSTDAQSGVNKYDVEANGTVLASVQGTNFLAEGLTEDTQYVFKIIVYDNVGNFAVSNQAGARTFLDTTLADPALVGSAVSHDVIKIKWTFQEDPNIKFRVYRNKVLVKTTGKKRAYFSGLDPNTSYEISVQAYTDDGDISALGETLVLRTDKRGRIVKWTKL